MRSCRQLQGAQQTQQKWAKPTGISKIHTRPDRSRPLLEPKEKSQSPGSLFSYNELCVLFRRARLDETTQKIVLFSLKKKRSGNQDRTWRYPPVLERHVCTARWDGLIVGHTWQLISIAMWNMPLLSKTLYALMHRNVVLLFWLKRPIKLVATYILRHLTKTKTVNRFIVAMTDKNPKMTWTTQSKTTVTDATRITVKYWVLPYGISGRLLTDNSSQLVSELFYAVCLRIGTRSLGTTAYRLQTSGQIK